MYFLCPFFIFFSCPGGMRRHGSVSFVFFCFLCFKYIISATCSSRGVPIGKIWRGVRARDAGAHDIPEPYGLARAACEFEAKVFCSDVVEE